MKLVLKPKQGLITGQGANESGEIVVAANERELVVNDKLLEYDLKGEPVSNLAIMKKTYDESGPHENLDVYSGQLSNDMKPVMKQLGYKQSLIGGNLFSCSTGIAQWLIVNLTRDKTVEERIVLPPAIYDEVLSQQKTKYRSHTPLMVLQVRRTPTIRFDNVQYLAAMRGKEGLELGSALLHFESVKRLGGDADGDRIFVELPKNKKCAEEWAIAYGSCELSLEDVDNAAVEHRIRDQNHRYERAASRSITSHLFPDGSMNAKDLVDIFAMEGLVKKHVVERLETDNVLARALTRSDHQNRVKTDIPRTLAAIADNILQQNTQPLCYIHCANLKQKWSSLKSVMASSSPYQYDKGSICVGGSKIIGKSAYKGTFNTVQPGVLFAIACTGVAQQELLKAHKLSLEGKSRQFDTCAFVGIPIDQEIATVRMWIVTHFDQLNLEMVDDTDRWSMLEAINHLPEEIIHQLKEKYEVVDTSNGYLIEVPHQDSDSLTVLYEGFLERGQFVVMNKHWYESQERSFLEVLWFADTFLEWEASRPQLYDWLVAYHHKQVKFTEIDETKATLANSQFARSIQNSPFEFLPGTLASDENMYDDMINEMLNVRIYDEMNDIVI